MIDIYANFTNCMMDCNANFTNNQQDQDPSVFGSTVDNYLIGISSMGFMLLSYQIIFYVSSAWIWYSSVDHKIKMRLLPLQIYMKDMDRIIEKLVQKGIAKRRIENLEKLVEEYNEFIEFDNFCWVKSKNPIYEKWKKAKNGRKRKKCCNRHNPPPLRFVYELCEYKLTADTPKSDHMKPRVITNKNRLKTSVMNFIGKSVSHKMKSYIYIQRQTYNASSCFYLIAYIFTCCNTLGQPKIISQPSLEVMRKNVYFGRYAPYLVDSSMECIDLDKDIKDIKDGGESSLRHRKTEGMDDKCSRFLCGWWKGWTLEDLELMFRTELDEEHLQNDLDIVF